MTETIYRTEAVINGETFTGINCANCGVTYAACTKRVLSTRSGRACCHECQDTDTHDVLPRATQPDDPMDTPSGVALRQLQGLYAECAMVGLPYDAAALVRHHRANAGLAATVDADTAKIKAYRDGYKDGRLGRASRYPARDEAESFDIEREETPTERTERLFRVVKARTNSLQAAVDAWSASITAAAEVQDS